MNAETRAKEIMAWLRQECSDSICTHLDCPSCGCMAYLTQAIHQAQNDKLEEAAREIESAIEPARQHCRDAEADVDPPEVTEVLFELMDNMVDLLAAVPDGIRDLKSKD